jgi:Bacterial PH domain
MASVPSTASPLVFRSAAAPWLTGFLVALGAAVAVLGLGGGPASAVASVLVGAALGQLGWWLYWRPHVVVEDGGVRIVNPLRTVVVPWRALVDVRTRFTLTLVTPRGAWSCFALPSGGASAALRGSPGDLEGTHPSTRPDGTVRSGDLLSTRGGAAADLIRRRWQSMVEDGTLDVFADRDADDDAVRTELHPAPALVLLVLAGLAAAALLLG